MGTLANSEDSDASVSALFAKTKSIFRQRNTFFWKVKPMTPQYIQIIYHSVSVSIACSFFLEYPIALIRVNVYLFRPSLGILDSMVKL